MSDSKTRKDNFIKDFDNLMLKHGADINLVYNNENGVDLEVTMESAYDYKTDTLIKEYCEFKLYI